jgi:hypothetical protein
MVVDDDDLRAVREQRARDRTTRQAEPDDQRATGDARVQ